MRAYAVRFFLPLQKLLFISSLLAQLRRTRIRPVAQSSVSFQALPMPSFPVGVKAAPSDAFTAYWHGLERSGCDFTRSEVSRLLALRYKYARGWPEYHCQPDEKKS